MGSPRICLDLEFGLSTLQNSEKYISVVYEAPSLWFSVISAHMDAYTCA